jgi:tetratricopeptide (TPR) repeat protein
MKAGKNILILLITGLFTAIYFQTRAQDLKDIHAKANKAIKQGRFDEAIPILKILVAKDSSDSETLFNLALAMYNTEDYHGCIKYSTQGIKVDSTYAAHHFRRGVCYGALEEYSFAIQDLTRAIVLDKKSFSYLNRGIARWKSGDIKGGITDFTASLALEPKSENGYYYRALCYEEIGDTIKAMDDLDKSIALRPKDPDIYDERAYLRFQSQNYLGAKADYLKCIKLDPAYIQAHLSLSEISLITGDWQMAYQHASNAVQYSSNKDEHAIALLFKCAANKLMDRNTSEDEAKLNKTLDELEETSWKFEDLQQALKNKNVSEAKRNYITLLIKSYNGE